MHDPLTVAHEILAPWSRRWPHGTRYRPSLATIWHRDPEADGSDDSCGWSYPKLTEEDRKLARDMASWETMHPHFFNQAQRLPRPEYPSLWEVSPGDGLALVVAAWATFEWRLHRRSLSPRLLAAAAAAATAPHDNYSHLLTASDEEGYYRGFCLLLRGYRRATRPWWRHPRWHIHHWELQVPFMQLLKRWLFSRCCRCGRGFRWGESVTTTLWDSKGPRWFRSERGVYHNGHCQLPTETP